MELIKDDEINETENYVEGDFKRIDVNNEKCLVNRENIEFFSSFSDMLPYYDSENKLHNKLQNGKIRELNSHCIDYIAHKKVSDFNSPDEYCEELCETKRNHVNSMIKNIYAMGYDTPSTVQSIAMAPIIDGKDVMIQFKSGTGKTLSQAMTLWGFEERNPSLQYIFLTTTHEVAKQIYDCVISIVPTAKTVLCIPPPKQESGGFRQKSDANSTSTNIARTIKTAQIIVGTIGKTYEMICLKGSMSRRNPKTNSTESGLDSVRSLVLDEFDRLLSYQKKTTNELSSSEQIKYILDMLPKETQRLFYSATVTKISGEIGQELFRKNVGRPFMFLLDEKNFVVNGISHYYVLVSSYEEKLDIIVELIGRIRNPGQCIIFVNCTETVLRLKEDFVKQLPNIKVATFYGKMGDEQRRKIFKEIGDGTCRYVIATDVLSRGIDARSVNFIVNFDMPDDEDGMQTYIHRIGRSGRYGRKGIAINFPLSYKNKNEMLKVEAINERAEKNKMKFLPENIEDLI